MQENNKATNSYKEMLENGNEYQQPIVDETMSPMAIIASNTLNVEEQENRKRWERIGAYNALGAIATTLGKGLAATAGIKTTPTDVSYIDNATTQIIQSDQRARQNYTNQHNDILKEAIRLKGLEQSNSVNYNNRLENTNQELNKYNITELKANSDSYRDEQKDDARMNRLQESNDFKSTVLNNNTSTENSTSTAKPNRIVYNELGQKVALMDEDITKLYKLAKEYKLTNEYDMSPSDFKRKQEFDLMIQQAYLLQERDINKLKQ